jgi:cytidine deaminase
MSWSNEAMIHKAAAIINPRKLGDYLIGDVGCALITEANNLYLGVCIDMMSGIGFCAEHSAIAAMVTAGEFKIQKVVAVWKNELGDIHIVSPCGRCREFMRQIHPDNIHYTDVILGLDKVVKLEGLLPHHTWYEKIQF